MNEINFLPPSFYRQRKRRRRLYIEAAVIALFAGLLAFAHVLGGQSLQSLRDYAAETEAVGTAAQQKFKDLAALQHEYRQLTSQLGIHRRVSPPVGFTPVLASISNLMPESIALTELKMDCPRPTHPPVELETSKQRSSRTAKSKAAAVKIVEKMRIELTGLSPDDARVADFVGKLAQSPLFTDVKLEFSRSTTQDGLVARRFRVSMLIPLDRDYRAPGRRESGTTQGVVHAD